MKQHLVNILVVVGAVCLCLCSVTNGRVLHAAREATVSGRCLTQTDAASMDLPDGTNSTEKATADTALKALRSSYVTYNQKKSMFRDGDILAVYTLAAGYKSLAGCASACLLDWRIDATTFESKNTTAYDSSAMNWSPSTTLITPFRECEAFNFNPKTGKCTLLSGQSYLQLTRSNNYYSGKVICADPADIDNWAEQVVA